MWNSSKNDADTIESFFLNEVVAFKAVLQKLAEEMETQAESDEVELLERFTEAFHQSREDCLKLEKELENAPQLLAEVQIRFREELSPWFNQSWFFERAKRKPRGYPGDFVMLTALYDEEPKSEGLGKILDLYFLQADLARAVRTRLAAIKEFVMNAVKERGEQLRILNVASGPGREYDSEFAEIADYVSLVCIDSDADALDYLQLHLDPKVQRKLDLNCVKYNALKTKSSKLNLKNFGAVDLIYSVGLCDYIPDHIMIRILEGWRESVAPGGIVYVAFKDSLEYVSSEYQWHADWHFFQRTEADCLRLFAEAGYEMDQLSMSRDETGIIMNFVYRTPVASGLRIESAHSTPLPHSKLRLPAKNEDVRPTAE